MKTISVLASVAAFVAFVLTQFSFQVSISLFFALGLIAITIADYSHAIRAATSSSPVAVTRSQRLRLAA